MWIHRKMTNVHLTKFATQMVSVHLYCQMLSAMAMMVLRHFLKDSLALQAQILQQTAGMYSMATIDLIKSFHTLEVKLPLVSSCSSLPTPLISSQAGQSLFICMAPKILAKDRKLSWLKTCRALASVVTL